MTNFMTFENFLYKNDGGSSDSGYKDLYQYQHNY